MSVSDSVVIVSARRTAMGRFRGTLAGTPAPRLGAAVLGAAVADAGIAPGAVDEVFMGCVLPAGQGQAPARQAMRHAGLPDATGATTVNKVCGSGMKALMIAHDLLKAESADIVAAGGMENMSAAPYLIQNARSGYGFGHDRLLDHAALDGLEDAYDGGRPMGTFGEDTAAKYGFTRAEQDEYAMETLRRAQAAVTDGLFADEITPLTIRGAKGAVLTMDTDEIPGGLDPARIPGLKPAFRPDGTITAAASSANADGAAALVLMRETTAKAMGLAPLARIVGHATHSQDPAWFTTAPIGAIGKLLKKTGWSVGDVDLFEINEAFAVVVMAAMRELEIARDRVNVNGGACALGHPIGASGARIVVTLLHALRSRGLSRGVACLCIGGGEATALAIERT
ncbi:acetyl-CoA C-acyltransferase [Zavarzinia compransoris]|uniref:acetyl-CoA C-acyltransferase n=1 Tax=Zavarzinia marina TaxID=2911065 RepID=UPI001F2AE298|nr:acetyl-CoA C-acyltransferase [Zavarzinia marina]MCF4165614.1 acetyl-CoA C-acyltransferase [Zavarzinia marina]